MTHAEKYDLIEKSINECMKLPNNKAGKYSISHFTVGKDDFHALVNGIPQGDYIKLSDNFDVIMSNTPMEKRTNTDLMMSAHGDVIVGGLGIGMVLYSLDNNTDVTSVTVLEKNKDIIELNCLEGRFSDKIKVIEADVFTWKPERGKKYDYIYMDIWAYVNSDVYKSEMVPLKRKYSRYLRSKTENPKRHVGCWAEWHAKNNRKLR